MVRVRVNSDEKSLLRRAVGRILGRILLEVLNRLYAGHPSPKPEGME
jgi:hypothetical protein